MGIYAGEWISKTERCNDCFKITIPSKKSLYNIIFISAFLIIWALVESSMVSMVVEFGGLPEEIAFWLLGWTYGGLYFTYILAWMLFGKEVIYNSDLGLVIEKRIFGLKYSKEYEMDMIYDMRVNFESSSRGNTHEYKVTGGNIIFDYGAKTIRFGKNICGYEAEHIIETIQKSVDRFGK
ncbi:hypothetical protein [Fusibacter sp. JL216-2]|uniref:hypothetical protein n=1 Tax=Fusibacter sp. JL216-2 TaxID=3071453 RepID=UPI003D33954A